MSGSTVEGVTARLLRLPLHAKYELSFTTLDAIDMILVRMVGDDGCVAFGESCPLPSYSVETLADVWSFVRDTAPTLAGTTIESASALITGGGAGPFARVALMTCLDGLARPVELADPVAVPLVGTIMTHEKDEIPAEVHRLSTLGYRTLKFKIGFGAQLDAARVCLVQQAMPADARIRLDANQGYQGLPQALEFFDQLDPTGIELVEQPFPAGAWDDMAALIEQGVGTPLMLDESIESTDDIERAAGIGVDHVKFKLVKSGSPGGLTRSIAHAKSHGLGVIVGNGVAGVVDNWNETLCAHGHVAAAGEMNGCLKLAAQPFLDGPRLESGMLWFPPGFRLDVDDAVLAEYMVDLAGT